MTPKEKASELVSKFMSKVISKYVAKDCALIAVDEILGHMGADRGVEFWQEVKKEIEAI
jgi:hypothetical protein